MRMGWHDLAFIHYPAPFELLSHRLPPGMELETFDGTAWIGLVPFRMVSVAPRCAPAVPFFSSFPEINVRTYVRVGDKPGVWFFSLDADSRPTVFAGRRFFGLPYHKANMRLTKRHHRFQLTSQRRRGDAVFTGNYSAAGETFIARPGSFEHWSTERYCLYSHSATRGLMRLEVHHEPWPLQRADVQIETSTMFAAAGLDFTPQPSPICHFSTGVEVVSFPPARLTQP
jgi:hypothetical protein